MATNTIKTRTLIAALALVAAVEWTAPWWIRTIGGSKLMVLAIIRAIEILGLIAILFLLEKGPASVGWACRTWSRGLKIGALWSVAFGSLTAVTMTVLYSVGLDPIAMLRAPLPKQPLGLLSLFLVGGFIGPVAEELCFRGLVYTFFRRWGVIAAMAVSTAIFAALHAVHGLPLVQITGGIVFAVAYETTGNLTVPMVIHVAANCAIFALSLPFWP